MDADDSFDQQKRDLDFIDGAGLKSHEKFVAQTTAFTIRFLHELSRKLRKPVAEITIQDVVAEMIGSRPAS